MIPQRRVLYDVEISSLEELRKLCIAFKDYLSKRDLVFFNGPLGAGKTTFVQNLVLAFGGQGVQSPTFSIHNEYGVRDKVIDHLDLYRLQSVDELESVGLWDLFAEPSGLILIEWAEKVPADLWPTDWTRFNIDIAIQQSGSRRYTIRRG